MKKRLKKFVNICLPNIICIFYLLYFLIMSNGYGILKERLDINGKTTIDIENVIEPKISYTRTEQYGNNVFFYNLTIYNNSSKDYKSWQVKINDTEYISYPFSITGERIDNAWLIRNLNGDEIIEAGGEVEITIIFEISDNLPSTINIEDYIENFLNSSIEITCSYNENTNNDLNVVKKGKAKLTLEKSEIEIKNFNIKVNLNYSTEIPDEKMYMLTINNDTDNDFVSIRGNIYLGTENKILEVSPSEVTCFNTEDVTFILPNWVNVPKGESLILYFMIIEKDDSFIDNIVLAATIS